MTILPLTLFLACQDGGNGGKNKNQTETEGPTAIEVNGWGTETAIAPNSGDSQGEPSSIALDDGSVLASWMQLDGYDLNVMLSRTDGFGEPWSTPIAIYDENRPYQNDPVLVQGGGYVYFLWLSVYGTNADHSKIFCVDSTDNGQTWSEPVSLDDGKEFNDRQWAAVDSSGRIVIEWDHFVGQTSEELNYVESPGGCANLSEPETVAKGSFLSGVPVIMPDGTVYTFRNQYGTKGIQVVMSKKTGSGWDDQVIFTDNGTDVTGVTAIEELEETAEKLERIEEYNEEQELMEALHQPAMPSRDPQYPKAVRDGNYDGVYAPSAQLLADGRIGLVIPGFESKKKVADVYFVRTDGSSSEIMKLNQDSGSNAQLLPWLDVDKGGGLHVTWYDAREGSWRVYQANSYDNGDTWDEMPLSDETFPAGFDDYNDPYSWVGHFMGLSHTDEHVVAIFGDSRSDGTSRIYADWSESGK